MTNEDKAYEILKSIVKHNQSLECYEQKGPYAAAMQMAKWKDEQFMEFLEWIDNVYVLRRFSDGESIDFKGLVEKFKLMQK